MVSRIADDSVSGYVHSPASTGIGALVLTHGAGLNCESPLLVALADALAAAGLLVLRCDLAFRRKRSTGPPHPVGAADDRQGLREALQKLTSLADGPYYLGGHSYGGRQASILVTEPEPPSVQALLLLSYPLHPPRKPEQLRSAHFSGLQTPCFFFHGTRDAFGSPEEMKQAVNLIPATTPRRLFLVEKTGHELAGGKTGVADLCASQFRLFVSSL